MPFETQATDWTDNGITVASINNFHEYEKKDGSGYETVLEVKKATSGEFEANTPYLLRTKIAEARLSLSIMSSCIRQNRRHTTA